MTCNDQKLYILTHAVSSKPACMNSDELQELLLHDQSCMCSRVTGSITGLLSNVSLLNKSDPV